MLHPRRFHQLCTIPRAWKKPYLPFHLEGFPIEYPAAMAKHTSIPFPDYMALNRQHHRGWKKTRQIKSLQGEVLSHEITPMVDATEISEETFCFIHTLTWNWPFCQDMWNQITCHQATLFIHLDILCNPFSAKKKKQCKNNYAWK